MMLSTSVMLGGESSAIDSEFNLHLEYYQFEICRYELLINVRSALRECICLRSY
jgi:hypothetical protein